jgi:hypothetical protein
LPGRGALFEEVEGSLKNILSNPGELKIKAVKGIDEICLHCPQCIDGQCVSPQGGEESVRKWDSILLAELKVNYDAELTSSEWQSLIWGKVPFKICPKCHWKNECRVGLNVP